MTWKTLGKKQENEKKTIISLLHYCTIPDPPNHHTYNKLCSFIWNCDCTLSTFVQVDHLILFGVHQNFFSYSFLLQIKYWQTIISISLLQVLDN
jgi:hypothetical protein